MITYYATTRTELAKPQASPPDRGRFYIVATTQAERPSAAGLINGDHFFAVDTGLLFIVAGGTWVATVLDTDSRLTNARAPTAHHATHETGGSDVVVHGGVTNSDVNFSKYKHAVFVDGILKDLGPL